MRAPDFWDRKTDGIFPALLRPLGCITAAMAALRISHGTPWKAPVPVICVGNLVAGGAGKTPVALDLVARLTARGLAVHVVMRGYGGTEIGPLRVDRTTHTAAQVGDEALLLAAAAPTWVSRDRKNGASAAVDAGAQIIVLDDGFQNTALHKDLKLLVVDGSYGFGNGRVMPAGPLRETIPAGLKRADALVLLGADEADVWGRVQRAGFKGLDVVRARFTPNSGALDLKGREVFAFAGIGRPQKFFDTVSQLGCKLVGCKAFDDHHPYSDAEVQAILDAAAGATVVTTTKDLVRLSTKHAKQVRAVSVDLVWKDDVQIDALLDKVIGDG